MAHAPENTALSLVTAEQLGVDEIEFDVRVSADGVAVISHDDDLSRVVGHDGPPVVSQTPWHELQSVRLPRGQRLLTLSEVLEVTEVRLQIELKAPEAATVVTTVLQDYPDDHPRCLVTSFQADILAELRGLLPSIPRGLITGRWRPEIIEQARQVDASAVFSGWDGLTSEVVDELHRNDYRVCGWPLRSIDDAIRATEIGLDGITADDPARARDWLSAAAVRMPNQAC